LSKPETEVKNSLSAILVIHKKNQDEKDTIGHIFTGQYYGLHYRLITIFFYLDLKDYIKNLTQHS
jgi:hypothetical protein